MPRTCAKIREFLNLDAKPTWNELSVESGTKLDKVEPLFARI